MITSIIEIVITAMLRDPVAHLQVFLVAPFLNIFVCILFVFLCYNVVLQPLQAVAGAAGF